MRDITVELDIAPVMVTLAVNDVDAVITDPNLEVQLGDGPHLDMNQVQGPIVSIGAIRGEKGVQGSQGVPGPPGPPGSGTVDEIVEGDDIIEVDNTVPGYPVISVNKSELGFPYEQGVASAVWVIPHNLGYKPGGVIVMDSGGTINEPQDIIHDSVNQMTLVFRAPFGGTAFLS